MSRKGNIPKREILPDRKFGSIPIAKLVNFVMKKGKKQIAAGIVYDTFDIIKKKTQQDPIEIFDKAMKNTMPYLEVKSKRIGGANYQVPNEVRGERRLTLSLRWILSAARAKKGRPMSEKLAVELMEAANNQGIAVKKKQDVQRMAEANRAFAHFA
ncbi:30S ribosomal protein S7 [bacterium]|nr:MAG: 30S ribosomal protein S7 [bacterium]